MHTAAPRWIFVQNVMKNLPGVKETWTWHKMCGLIPWPLIVTLRLNIWIIGSAHRLNDMEIWPKFNENPFTGKRDMEWTRNSRLNSMAFNCDIDLESAWLNLKIAHWLSAMNIQPKYNENLTKSPLQAIWS